MRILACVCSAFTSSSWAHANSGLKPASADAPPIRTAVRNICLREKPRLRRSSLPSSVMSLVMRFSPKKMWLEFGARPLSDAMAKGTPGLPAQQVESAHQGPDQSQKIQPQLIANSVDEEL